MSCFILPMTIVIAQGKPLVPGKDAKLDTYFEERVQSEYNEVDGVVDFATT